MTSSSLSQGKRFTIDRLFERMDAVRGSPMIAAISPNYPD
jgi:hypothetical protein